VVFNSGGVEGDLPVDAPVLVISPLRYMLYMVSTAPAKSSSQWLHVKWL
jgi:hypothetical protein